MHRLLKPTIFPLKRNELRESKLAIRARKAKSSQFGGAFSHRNYSTKQFSSRCQISRAGRGLSSRQRRPGVSRPLLFWDISWHEDAFYPAKFSQLGGIVNVEILIKLFGQIRNRAKLGCRKTSRESEKLADGGEPGRSSPLNFIMAASARPWPCRAIALGGQG
jgi:hypothetical protein